MTTGLLGPQFDPFGNRNKAQRAAKAKPKRTAGGPQRELDITPRLRQTPPRREPRPAFGLHDHRSWTP